MQVNLQPCSWLQVGDCFQHLKSWAGATHDGCCSSPRAEPPQPGSRDAAGPQCTPGLINDIWFRGICVELKAQVKQDKLYQYVIRRRVEWLHFALISPASAGCEKKLCLPVTDLRIFFFFLIFQLALLNFWVGDVSAIKAHNTTKKSLNEYRKKQSLMIHGLSSQARWVCRSHVWMRSNVIKYNILKSSSISSPSPIPRASRNSFAFLPKGSP